MKVKEFIKALSPASLDLEMQIDVGFASYQPLARVLELKIDTELKSLILIPECYLNE